MTPPEAQAADLAEAERLAALIGGPCDHIRRTCVEIDCKMPRDVAAIAAALEMARQDERDRIYSKVTLLESHTVTGTQWLKARDVYEVIRGSDAAR